MADSLDAHRPDGSARELLVYDHGAPQCYPEYLIWYKRASHNPPRYVLSDNSNAAVGDRVVHVPSKKNVTGGKLVSSEGSRQDLGPGQFVSISNSGIAVQFDNSGQKRVWPYALKREGNGLVLYDG